MAVITLTTDFGLADHYVACMKGTILKLAPETRLIDITHMIRRHDVVHAAFVLRNIFDHFPRGTIHVIVVDPGVGTTRQLLAGLYSGQLVLAPDNGILSLIHRDFPLADIRVIENQRLFRTEISHTFHGRDVLAPVAAALATGIPLSTVGKPAMQIEMLNLPRPLQLPDGGVEGQVLYCDAFGNLITNIARTDLEHVLDMRRPMHVYVGPLRVGPLRRTYAEVDAGEILAIIGSTGSVEVAINQGNARERLRAGPGASVIVRPGGG